MKLKHRVIALTVTTFFSSLLFSMPLYALDNFAPIIRLSILGGTHEIDEPLSVSAKVTSDQSVGRVVVRYHPSNSTNSFPP